MFGINGTGDTSGYGRLVREVALPSSTPYFWRLRFDELVDRLAEVLGTDEFAAAVNGSWCSATNWRSVANIWWRWRGALQDDESLRFELSCVRSALSRGHRAGTARVLPADVRSPTTAGCSWRWRARTPIPNIAVAVFGVSDM